MNADLVYMTRRRLTVPNDAVTRVERIIKSDRKGMSCWSEGMNDWWFIDAIQSRNWEDEDSCRLL